MREILFRGNTASGEWVYGSYHHSDYIYIDGPVRRHYILPVNAQDAVVVLPETVGQYTGLTDKNGTKIFEGDVVKAVLPPTDSRSGFEWRPDRVAYVECAFGIAYSKHDFVPFRSFASSVQFEVIGNVHDSQD